MSGTVDTTNKFLGQKPNFHYVIITNEIAKWQELFIDNVKIIDN
jgi:hypothetical protein